VPSAFSGQEGKTGVTDGPYGTNLLTKVTAMHLNYTASPGVKPASQCFAVAVAVAAALFSWTPQEAIDSLFCYSCLQLH
jgi:hypothetical protein